MKTNPIRTLVCFLVVTIIACASRNRPESKASEAIRLRSRVSPPQPVPKVVQTKVRPGHFLASRDLDGHLVYYFNVEDISRWPRSVDNLVFIYLRHHYLRIPKAAAIACPRNILIHGQSRLETIFTPRSSTNWLEATIPQAFIDNIERCIDQFAPRLASRPLLLDSELPLPSMPPGSEAAVNLSDELTDPTIIMEARAWAAQHLNTNSVRELQEFMGLTPTGVYDDAVVRAVYRLQNKWSSTNPVSIVRARNGSLTEGPGVASEQWYYRWGLIPFGQIPEIAVNPSMERHLHATATEGLVVTFYPAYSGVPGGRHIQELAERFAEHNQTVGIRNGAIAVSVAEPIMRVGDIIVKLRAIHRALPATRISNVAIFSHGLVWGLGLNRQNRFRHGGLQDCRRDNCWDCDQYNNCDYYFAPDIDHQNVTSFSKHLNTIIGNNIRVLFFACMTAASPQVVAAHQDEWREGAVPPQRQRGGEGSLAEIVARKLSINNASVLGHTTLGDASENYEARVCGREAGAGRGCVHIFDILYPEDFIQRQLTRLHLNASKHDSLRGQMWDHYRCNVKRDLPVAKCETLRSIVRMPHLLGQEMFIRPSKAAEWLQSHWESVVKPETKGPST